MVLLLSFPIRIIVLQTNTTLAKRSCFAWFYMVLCFIDTIEVILSDWRDTGSMPSENLKRVALLPVLSKTGSPPDFGKSDGTGIGLGNLTSSILAQYHVRPMINKDLGNILFLDSGEKNRNVFIVTWVAWKSLAFKFCNPLPPPTANGWQEVHTEYNCNGATLICDINHKCTNGHRGISRERDDIRPTRVRII